MQVAEKERMPRLSLGEERNMVTQLLLLNITVYILLFFIKIIYQMENSGLAAFERDIMHNTQFPADPSVLLTKPWTVLTAMFAHVGFWDIFSNMVWLFCFGTILQNISGFRVIVPLYVFGSICGMAFYMAGMHLAPGLKIYAPSASIIGAGAGVAALATGIIAIAPRHRVFPLLLKGGIPAWILVVIFAGLHLTNQLSNSHYTTRSQGLYLMGGAALGLIFMIQYKRGRNWGTPVNKVIFNAGHIFHPKEQKQLLKEEYLEPTKPTGATPFQKVGAVPEHKLNELLDKINAQGLHSLTPEERDTLLRASKERGEDF